MLVVAVVVVTTVLVGGIGVVPRTPPPSPLTVSSLSVDRSLLELPTVELSLVISPAIEIAELEVIVVVVVPPTTAAVEFFEVGAALWAADVAVVEGFIVVPAVTSSAYCNELDNNIVRGRRFVVVVVEVDDDADVVAVVVVVVVVPVVARGGCC